MGPLRWTLRSYCKRWLLPHKPEFRTHVLRDALDSGFRRNDEPVLDIRRRILGLRLLRIQAIAGVFLLILAACNGVIHYEAPATTPTVAPKAQLLATATAVAPTAPDMLERLAQECRRYGNCDEQPHWDAIVLALEQRPLQLPRLDPDSACPEPSIRSVEGYDFEVIGVGPVYSLPYRLHVSVNGSSRYARNGWHWNKVVWARDPQYTGPVVIRGRQLDGPATLRFQWIKVGHPASELAQSSLHVSPYSLESSRLTDGSGSWEEMMTWVVVRAPGCYGVQIDGVDFSNTIVFRVHGK